MAAAVPCHTPNACLIALVAFGLSMLRTRTGNHRGFRPKFHAVDAADLIARLLQGRLEGQCISVGLISILVPAGILRGSWTVSTFPVLNFAFYHRHQQKQLPNMTELIDLPGRWPGESRGESRGESSELLYPRINTQVGGSSTNHSAASSSGSNDELFFECPTPSPSPGIERNGESSMLSYLIFEPVVESVEREKRIDWRRYEPPRELLHLGENTSDEIQRIMEPSIQNIKARYAEEETRRMAQARRERPVARAGRASVKPLKREVSHCSQ